MRLDGDGSLAWALRGGGLSMLRSDDVTHGAAVLADGDFVFSGGFSGAATFESVDGADAMAQSSGSWDAFVVRYDAGGRARWVKTVRGLDNDEWAIDVVETPVGSLGVAGAFGSTDATFGGGEANETTLVGSGLAEAFVALYSSKGTLQWVRSSASSNGGFASASGISAKASGLAVCGEFSGQVTMGAGEPAETTWNAEEFDAFVATYGLDGAFVWGRRIHGPGDDWAQTIVAIDGDSLVVAGSFEEDTAIDSGPSGIETVSSDGGSDVFLARYNESGILSWEVRAGGPGDDVARALAALPDGGVLVAGSFSGRATFGSGSGAVVLESVGAEDIFVAHYDADGEVVSAQRAGGQFADEAFGIAATETGDALVTGYFSDVATFFPGTPYETTLTSRGGTDIFVARMPP